MFWFHVEELLLDAYTVEDASAPSVADQRQHIKAQLYEGRENDLKVFIDGQWVEFDSEEQALRVKFHREKDPKRKQAILDRRKQLRKRNKRSGVV